MFKANYLSVSTNENTANHVQTPVCIKQTQLCSVFSGAWLRAHSYEKGAVCVLSSTGERETRWRVFAQTGRNQAQPHQQSLPLDTASGIPEVTKPSGLNAAPKSSAIYLGRPLLCLGHLIPTESCRGAATSEMCRRVSRSFTSKSFLPAALLKAKIC